MLSLIEYSSTIYTITNPRITKSVQILQNEAQSEKDHEDEKRRRELKLHTASNIPVIEDRIKDLTVEYFVRSQKNNIQLINQLINEYSKLPNSPNPTIIWRISSESSHKTPISSAIESYRAEKVNFNRIYMSNIVLISNL